MFNKISCWFNTDAKWNEFWMPQSGIAGGYILVSVFAMTLNILERAFL